MEREEKKQGRDENIKQDLFPKYSMAHCRWFANAVLWKGVALWERVVSWEGIVLWFYLCICHVRTWCWDLHWIAYIYLYFLYIRSRIMYPEPWNYGSIQQNHDNII